MTILASDSFTQANGGLSGNYTSTVGAGLIVTSNVCRGVSNEERASLRTAETYAADQYVEFTLGTETNSFVGGLLRHSGADGTRNGYAADCGFNDTVYITRYVNGVGTNLVDGATVVWASGDRLRAEMIDWTINLYKNGSLVATAVDTLELYATGALGLYMYSDGALDNAEFGNVGAALSEVPTKTYNGSIWTERSVNTWNGSVWTPRRGKRYDGTSWA